MRKILFILTALLVGCKSVSPILNPVSQGETTSAKESINVFVKPVITHGFGSDDEKQWKMDVSAYFTAFEVALVNNTSKTISFDPQKSYLNIEGDRRLTALDEAESVEYYTVGDETSGISFFPKSRKKLAEEIAKIKSAGMPGGTVEAGGQQRGLLFFKKVKPDRCKDVVLILEGISVDETGEEKRFSFAFSCKITG